VQVVLLPLPIRGTIYGVLFKEKPIHSVRNAKLISNNIKRIGRNEIGFRFILKGRFLR